MEDTEQTEPLIGDERAQEEGRMRKFKINSDMSTYRENKKRYTANDIKTSKYNLIPLHVNFFLWRNLFEQFGRYANIYFLVVGCLQVIPGLSPTGRYTTIGPLGFVLSVSMVKACIEDYQKHTRDRETNNQRSRAYRDGWVEIPWKDICVGDIVEVANGQEFPADLLLMYAPTEKGTCYIETSNLDGETNLKLRKQHQEPLTAPASLAAFNPNDPGKYAGTVACKHPDEDMYIFEGYLERVDATNRHTRAPVDFFSILLRGARLGTNVDRIIGIVVYTGKETKLMMNQKDSELKTSQLERNTNTQIFRIFILDLFFVVFCAIGLAIKTSDFNNYWYLAPTDIPSAAMSSIEGFGTFLILFNNLVPISLYVSMELVKLMQAKNIRTDLQMYYAENDMPAVADSSALNEELGQVQYVFSDKTGTLTCNIMDFLKISVGATTYGTEQRTKGSFTGRKGFNFYDDRISEIDNTKQYRWMNESNQADLSNFFRTLALCHSVVTEGKGDDLKYQSQSPDETCLVTGTKYLGFEFIERTSDNIVLHIRSKSGEKTVEKWKILHTLEFNSDRKRMSVIVRDPTGKLLLLCKGADTVIYERLKKTPNAQERHIQEVSKAFLTAFAKDGLRTLCIATATLDEHEYAKWMPKFKKATESIGDRERLTAEAAEEIEQNLELIGTTAIEDKLQDGVPETIEVLRAAGIKVWVLTGDKQETAINIGFSCRLLNDEMGIFKFHDTTTESNISLTLQNYARDAESVKRDYGQDLAIVVQGNTLQLILGGQQESVRQQDSRNAQYFLNIAKHCKVVICCRVTPGQKAQVVKLVKDNLREVTLAIGDGANDVSMIKEAHVGIGISGLEGKQAANAADYAIGQFKYLQRLLLVHGRWNYRRVSKLILYSFYKNISLYLTQFWYTIFNAFTGQSLYDSFSLMGFNVSFTFLPILVLAILDRDVEPKRLVGDADTPGLSQFPELYSDGRKGKLFNTRIFWFFTFNAIFHSAVCFFLPAWGIQDMGNPDNGWVFGLPELGVIGYTSVIFVVTLKICLETTSFTSVHIFVYASALASWFLFLIIYCNWFALTEGTSWYLIHKTLGYAYPWCIIVVTVVTCLLRDFVWKVYKRQFEPNLAHVIQIWERRGRDFDREVLKGVCVFHICFLIVIIVIFVPFTPKHHYRKHRNCSLVKW